MQGRPVPDDVGRGVDIQRAQVQVEALGVGPGRGEALAGLSEESLRPLVAAQEPGPAGLGDHAAAVLPEALAGARVLRQAYARRQGEGEERDVIAEERRERGVDVPEEVREHREVPLGQVKDRHVRPVVLAGQGGALHPEGDLEAVEPLGEHPHEPGRAFERDVPVGPGEAEAVGDVLGGLAEAVVEAGLERGRFAGVEQADARALAGAGAGAVLAQELPGPDAPRGAAPLGRDLARRMDLGDRPPLFPMVAARVGGRELGHERGVLVGKRRRVGRGDRRPEGPRVRVAVEDRGEPLDKQRASGPGPPRRWRAAGVFAGADVEGAPGEGERLRGVDADRGQEVGQDALPVAVQSGLPHSLESRELADGRRGIAQNVHAHLELAQGLGRDLPGLLDPLVGGLHHARRGAGHASLQDHPGGRSGEAAGRRVARPENGQGRPASPRPLKGEAAAA